MKKTINLYVYITYNNVVSSNYFMSFRLVSISKPNQIIPIQFIQCRIVDCFVSGRGVGISCSRLYYHRNEMSPAIKVCICSGIKSVLLIDLTKWQPKKKELQRNVIQHQNVIMNNFIQCWCGGRYCGWWCWYLWCVDEIHAYI